MGKTQNKITKFRKDRACISQNLSCKFKRKKKMQLGWWLIVINKLQITEEERLQCTVCSIYAEEMNKDDPTRLMIVIFSLKSYLSHILLCLEMQPTVM